MPTHLLRLQLSTPTTALKALLSVCILRRSAWSIGTAIWCITATVKQVSVLPRWNHISPSSEYNAMSLITEKKGTVQCLRTWTEHFCLQMPSQCISLFFRCEPAGGGVERWHSHHFHPGRQCLGNGFCRCGEAHQRCPPCGVMSIRFILTENPYCLKAMCQSDEMHMLFMHILEDWNQ